MLGNGLSRTGVVCASGGSVGLEVVHDEERRGVVQVRAAERSALRLLHIFAQRISLDAESEGWTARCDGNAHVRVAGGGLGEEEEMRDTERTGHVRVILQFVAAAFLDAWLV